MSEETPPADPPKDPPKDPPADPPKDPPKNKAKQESEDLITQSNAAAIRTEEATVKLKEQLDRQERMIIENKLSGSTEAGGAEPTTEEKEIESSRKLLEGTGYDEELFPKNPKKT